MRIELDVAALGATRFAVSPITQTVAAVLVLTGRRHSWVAQPWAAGATDRFQLLRRSDPAVRALAMLLRSSGYNADFITPPPTIPAPTVEQELAAIRATSPEQVRREIRRVFGDGAVPRPIGRVLAGDRPADHFADGVQAVWQALLAPEWPRMQAVLDREIARRAARLTSHGWQVTLNEMTPLIRWAMAADGRCTMDVPGLPSEDRVVHADGITFVPNTFDAMWVCLDPPWHNAIVYPASGIAALWQPEAEHILPRLSELIGRARAQVLLATGSPVTTTQLSHELTLSLGAVGGHLAVLRRAGLVTGTRVGRQVLYRRTSLGSALLGESDR